MVAQLDKDSGEVKLLSIPRDFYVQIPDAEDPYQKVNAAYAIGGSELAVQTIEELTSIPIDHYAAIDFKGFKELIDSVGGVTVEVDKTYHEDGYSNIDLEPGTQSLSGEEALSYVRFRHDPQGDLGRIERQQALISALVDELFSVQGVKKSPELMRLADEYVTHDLSKAQAVSLGWELRDVQKSDDIKSATLEGYPTFLEDEGSVLIPETQRNDELISPFKE